MRERIKLWNLKCEKWKEPNKNKTCYVMLCCLQQHFHILDVNATKEKEQHKIMLNFLSEKRESAISYTLLLLFISLIYSLRKAYDKKINGTHLIDLIKENDIVSFGQSQWK